MKLLLYCTKSKVYLYKMPASKKYSIWNNFYLKGSELNGKIVAECDFEVEEIINNDLNYALHWYPRELLKKSCLDGLDLRDYLKRGNGYAIHIKNLHIFNELMGLSEYNNKIEHKKCDNCEEHCKFYYNKNTMSGEINKGCTEYHYIQKAPQNMMYATDLKTNNDYILISIRPEWLCKILNGEKTIEVRKKVLKEMLNDK